MARAEHSAIMPSPLSAPRPLTSVVDGSTLCNEWRLHEKCPGGGRPTIIALDIDCAGLLCEADREAVIGTRQYAVCKSIAGSSSDRNDIEMLYMYPAADQAQSVPNGI
jgi:hypothetical protein